ncbi:STAS/SEC14 domain-containing protein [Photobacterium chitinilyticum]|uniref:STAS/SEC14 domain-containing protein n=1 Tax=Photobacterium chitinilyticum TaxID=2485123 RepID=A0A444JTA9_9GAMM|nr:STAS/SEC14 domain-containing protein [Photobacterium chitinilyticum]RWX56341.1 STAS/SEC14 domain-containing protein [Photobacterium chitinilyticum]
MSNLHGISMDVERVDEMVFMEFKAIGTLTHADYEKITPMIEDALVDIEKPIVNVYVDGTEFQGWQLQAAWDDLKLGLKHGKKFNKVAFYGNSRWQEVMSKVGSWFVSGEVKYFDEPLDALSWLRG